MSLGIFTLLRQNHALEHATMALLTGKLGMGTRLIGRSTTSGFYIYGDVPTQLVEEAATEGLARLQQGESELAVSSLCGTNAVVAAVLAGASSTLVLRGEDGLRKLSRAILAALVAVLASQPLGRLAQLHLTTLSEVADISIAGISRKGEGPRTRHKIKTARRE